MRLRSSPGCSSPRDQTERATALSLLFLPNMDNARAIRDTVARLISDVYAGKLQPRIKAGLAPLMHVPFGCSIKRSSRSASPG